MTTDDMIHALKGENAYLRGENARLRSDAMIGACKVGHALTQRDATFRAVERYRRVAHGLRKRIAELERHAC